MKTAMKSALCAALGSAPALKGALLLDVPAGADPQRVMQLARQAFAGRKWAVSGDADGGIVARIRNFDVDATLKVFLADGALRFVDHTVDRKGGKADVPLRWLNYIRADLRGPLERLARAEPRPGERLRRLQGLLDQGLISRAEYDAKRSEILKGL